MNCHEVKRRLGRYLDGELSVRENLLVEQHLGRCPTCLDELTELSGIECLLRDVAPPPAPQGLTQRIVAKGFGARGPAGTPWFRWSFGSGIGSMFPRRPMRVASALTAVLALLTGWTLGRGTAASNHPPPLMRGVVSEGTEWFSAMPPGSMLERYLSLTRFETPPGRNP